MPVLKNPKHEKFAQELAMGKTADNAYVLAGFKEHRSNAARLSANEHIAARVEEILSKAAKKVGITIERVLDELAKLGFSNMLDYTTVGSNGDPFVDLSQLSRDKASAIQEITVEDFTDGRGEDTRDVKRIKFKLYDKRAALVDLGKHLGMFKEKVEFTGKDGAPISIITNVMTAEQAAEAYASTLNTKP